MDEVVRFSRAAKPNVAEETSDQNTGSPSAASGCEQASLKSKKKRNTLGFTFFRQTVRKVNGKA